MNSPHVLRIARTLSLALLFASEAWAAPKIFIHTKHAMPGDMITLHGAGFIEGGQPPSVYIDPVPSTGIVPLPTTLAPEVIQYSPTLIHVRVPSSTPKGLYALYVKVSGTANTVPVLINRPEPWQTLGLAGTQVYPGRRFQLTGWNMELSGTTPKVWFKDQATGTRLAAVMASYNNKNIASLIAPSGPSGIQPGKNYQLIVSNGYGGTTGETPGPVLSCVAQPVDALNIGGPLADQRVPWADEFAFAATNQILVNSAPYNAEGDGVTDDYCALQRACDAAAARPGGAGVRLSNGHSYNLGHKILRVGSNTVLMAPEGGAAEIKGTIMPVRNTTEALHHVGLVNIKVTGGSVGLTNASGQPGGPFIILRSRIDNERVAEKCYYASNVDCGPHRGCGKYKCGKTGDPAPDPDRPALTGGCDIQGCVNTGTCASPKVNCKKAEGLVDAVGCGLLNCGVATPTPTPNPSRDSYSGGCDINKCIQSKCGGHPKVDCRPFVGCGRDNCEKKIEYANFNKACTCGSPETCRTLAATGALDFANSSPGVGLDITGSERIVIRDSIIRTLHDLQKGVFKAYSTKYLLLKDSEIDWREGRLEISGSRDFHCENVILTRHAGTSSDGSAINYGGFEASYCSNLAMIQNTFRKLGTGKIIFENDGESIMDQGICRLGTGYVTAADNNTLTDTDTKETTIDPGRRDAQGNALVVNRWEDNMLIEPIKYGSPLPMQFEAAYVTIVSGRGEGQMRKIIGNTKNRLTVEPAWDIIPDTSSAYAVSWLDRNWLITENTYTDVPKAVHLYIAPMSDVVISRNVMTNSGDINIRGEQRRFNHYEITDGVEQQLASTSGRFNILRNILVEENDMFCNNHDYTPSISVYAVTRLNKQDDDTLLGETQIGNHFWDVMVRANVIESERDFYGLYRGETVPLPAPTPGRNMTYDKEGNPMIGTSVGVRGHGYHVVCGVWDTLNTLEDNQSPRGVLLDSNRAIGLDSAFHVTTGSYETTIWKSETEDVGEVLSDNVWFRGGYADTATQTSLKTKVVRLEDAYLNTWSSVGNISLDRDPISPPAFFGWTETGTASVTTNAFGQGDINTCNCTVATSGTTSTTGLCTSCTVITGTTAATRTTGIIHRYVKCTVTSGTTVTTGTCTSCKVTTSSPSDCNERAKASSYMLRMTTPAGSNSGVGNAVGGGTHFKEVTKLINSLQAGTYTLTLSFDYATNMALARSYKLLFYSSNGNKDSGGDDRWVASSNSIPLPSLNNINKFQRHSMPLTFKLVNSSAATPRPEGTFEVGKFTGFSLRLYQDAQAAGTDLSLRLDNLAMTVEKN